MIPKRSCSDLGSSGRDQLGLPDRHREQAGARDITDLHLGAGRFALAALKVERDQLGQFARLFRLCKVTALVIVLDIGVERYIEEKALHLSPFLWCPPVAFGATQKAL